MAQEIFSTIDRLRLLTQRTVLLFAAAASVGVVLIPLAYRAHLEQPWIVIIPTMAYFAASAYRLLGGFQTDRQIEFEERFIRFAVKQNRLLASVQGFGKLWKLSCVVQGLSLAEQAVSRDSERGAILRKSLRASSRPLLPPIVPIALVMAGLVAAAWIWVMATEPAARGVILYLAVLPSLSVIGFLERRLRAQRTRMEQKLVDLVDQIAHWAEEDWLVLKDRPTSRPFQHRLYYRDQLY